MSILTWPAVIAMAVTRARSPIADLMEREPDAWLVDEHYAKHVPTEIDVWIANGPWFVRVELALNPGRWEPGWAERRLIWSAYRRYLQRKHRCRTERAVNRLIQRHLDAADGAP